MGPDGAPALTERPKPTPRGPRPVSQRTKPAAFLRGVRDELRKVAWPTRDEVSNYSMVVFISLAVIILLIFVLDLTFSKSVLFLFKT
ncbi:MAG: preprotein translocase subunit SecE [Acidimicrobiaceae bacterium]|nr:preprotein translocase subunit SecE [Acidimicrobiaceae bacterium]